MFGVLCLALVVIAFILIATLSPSESAVAFGCAFLGGIAGSSVGVASGGDASAGTLLVALVAFDVGGLSALIARKNKYNQAEEPDAAVSHLPNLLERAQAKAQEFVSQADTADKHQPSKQPHKAAPRPHDPPSKEPGNDSSSWIGKIVWWLLITPFWVFALCNRSFEHVISEG